MSLSAKVAPKVNVPAGSQCCQLSIINTTCDITVPPNYLVEPEIKGYEWMSMPTYSFHIKHQASGKQLLFDLGARKDWENHVPHIEGLLRGHVPGIKITKDVLDILPDGGVDIDQVEALILSHWHFDHCGAPSKLPKAVKVVVGPGFKDAFLPGYPAREDSPFHEADFADREVVEAPFTDELKIGQFQAHDYFGDGSFYVLNVPGHAVGHISGLIRTTPDTFVFLGGDVCHHTGDIRPSEYIPMPEELPQEAVLDKRITRPCPCSAFLSSHPKGLEEGKTNPFLRPSSGPNSFYIDPHTAWKSVDALIEFDADPNILTAIAHDPASLEVFDFFPKTMNDWKAKHWKALSHWGFLSGMPYNGQCIRPQRVDGLYRGGEKLRGLELSS